MKLGIINTRCKRKKSFLNLFKRKIIENRYCFKCLSVIEKNIFLSERRINKLINSIEENLLEQVDLIYRKSNDIHDFFLNLCIILYKDIIERENLKPYKIKLLIYDKEFSACNKSFFEKLCYIVSECNIVSDKKNSVNELCDYMKKQYGATYKACDDPALYKYDAVIDLDKFSFRMGRNIYINEFDFDFSDIENKLNLTQFNIASFLFYSGYRVELNKIEGRKAFFKFNL